MDHTASLDASIISILISISDSLRWLRRAMTLILVLAHFAIVFWGR
jgi:hypothetical protein